MPNEHILIVDDEPDIRSLLKDILEDEGYDVAVAENAEVAELSRQKQRPDLVLLDIWMPDMDGISLLKQWNNDKEASSPVIMMSGHGTVETAVEATRIGAYDFIEKPVSLGKLLTTVQRALEEHKNKNEPATLRYRLSSTPELVGHSKIIKQLREQTQRIAQHEAPVLIQGELGNGKNIIARFLHINSHRKNGPFIDAGVTALTAGKLTEIFFGREEGDEIHPGLLEQATTGSLFLDDIGDLDLDTQGQLLSALETGRFHRQGGSTPVTMDVRIIAASHYDLNHRCAEGHFHSELYHHLNVIPLYIPPLREHLEDVPDLINFYVAYFVDHDGLSYRNFNVAAKNRLRHYHWPGNIRELRNLVQRLLIVGTGNEINVDEVETALATQVQASPSIESNSSTYKLPLREAREQFERAYFQHLLHEMGGNIVKISQHAGIERTHLYRKLRALGIDNKQK
ncbi:MAG: sigma-54-dependent Fis family transcriptional regulator [Gammaproteobacteria bacterium]|nr:sigma-54-dependent Fis family transcriptional regulator [Gammaproteobacteria bacterium]